MAGAPLCATEHQHAASRGCLEAKAHQCHATKGRLAAILDGAQPMDKRCILQLAETGAWLSTLPSLLNGSENPPQNSVARMLSMASGPEA